MKAGLSACRKQSISNLSIPDSRQRRECPYFSRAFRAVITNLYLLLDLYQKIKVVTSVKIVNNKIRIYYLKIINAPRQHFLIRCANFMCLEISENGTLKAVTWLKTKSSIHSYVMHSCISRQRAVGVLPKISFSVRLYTLYSRKLSSRIQGCRRNKNWQKLG